MNAAGNNGGNDHSSLNSPPSISDDGRFVAFDSQAGDLVSNDTNGAGAFGTDVFVRDLQSDITILASINSAGTGSGNLSSFGSTASISGSGQFVVFGSNATNLVTGLADSNASPDIFIRNLVNGSTSIVSVNSAGNATGSAPSQFPAVSDDGRFVAFTSQANNLVLIDTNNGVFTFDVFVRDMLMGTTELVSANSAARALRRVAENSSFAQQEINRAFVLMQYYGYLRRNPNDAPDSDHTGYDFWLSKLNQFNGNFVNAEMVKAFIVSGEYRQRFGQ